MLPESAPKSPNYTVSKEGAKINMSGPSRIKLCLVNTCADILKPRRTNGQETTGQLQVTTAQDTSLQKSSGENANRMDCLVMPTCMCPFVLFK